MPIELKEKEAILAERICKRLVEVAREMAAHDSGRWDDKKQALLSLTADDFEVIYDLPQYKGDTLNLLQPIVQDISGDKSPYPHYEFFSDLYTLITFNAKECTDYKKRCAAVLVASYFNRQVSAVREDKPDRPWPSGFSTSGYGDYGIVTAHQFDQFAFVINGALKKHALPEKFHHDLIYPEGPNNARHKQIPRP